MSIIKIKRGTILSNMPVLEFGELAYSSSNNGLYIGGDGTGNQLLNPKIDSGTAGITPEGGTYITLINNTGATSVKGAIVAASLTVDNACILAPANSTEPIGVIYESGVANGQPVKVIVCGIAKVLMKDDVSSTRGGWLGVSDTAGRAYWTSESLGSKEIGHPLESKTAGTNVLCNTVLHFN